MVFNSIDFAVFLPLVALAWLACPWRWRWLVLLVANGVFYLPWGILPGLTLTAQTLVSFTCGLILRKVSAPRPRRRWLTVSVVAILAPLLGLKYLSFAGDSIATLLSWSGVETALNIPAVALPIGLSFYTFQALAYVFDVYRHRVDAEEHLGRYAAFLSFFPTVLMGPIERAGRLLPQLKGGRHLDVTRLTSGLRLFTWGLFQKVVVADRLAVYVNAVYADPHAFSGASLLLATGFFTFQIYCDFAGYSDMAVGAARMMGLELTVNFRLPYFAPTITEFWRRWHISLTSWFRDYVYIPLGGNRVPTGRWAVNILLVFVLSGLWHGAAWTFVAWGALHGIAYLAERALGNRAGRLVRGLPFGGALCRAGSHLLTLSVVAAAWVFFRAASVPEAAYILKQIALHPAGNLYRGASQLTTFLSLFFVAVLLAVQAGQARWVTLPENRFKRTARRLRWGAYALLVLSIALFGMSRHEFLYFQF